MSGQDTTEYLVRIAVPELNALLRTFRDEVTRPAYEPDHARRAEAAAIQAFLDRAISTVVRLQRTERERQEAAHEGEHVETSQQPDEGRTLRQPLGEDGAG